MTPASQQQVEALHSDVREFRADEALIKRQLLDAFDDLTTELIALNARAKRREQLNGTHRPTSRPDLASMLEGEDNTGVRMVLAQGIKWQHFKDVVRAMALNVVLGSATVAAVIALLALLAHALKLL